MLYRLIVFMLLYRFFFSNNYPEYKQKIKQLTAINYEFLRELISYCRVKKIKKNI